PLFGSIVAFAWAGPAARAAAPATSTPAASAAIRIGFAMVSSFSKGVMIEDKAAGRVLPGAHDATVGFGAARRGLPAPSRRARGRRRRGCRVLRGQGLELSRRIRRGRGLGVRRVVPAAPSARARRADGGRLVRVLVIEDEQKISQFLKKGLTEKGYVVETASDADTALERIAFSPFDLI